LMRTMNIEIMRLNQLVQDVYSRFGTVAAAYHSKLSDGLM